MEDAILENADGIDCAAFFSDANASRKEGSPLRLEVIESMADLNCVGRAVIAGPIEAIEVLIDAPKLANAVVIG